MLESLFNKVVGLRPKETPTQVFSYEICKIFQNTYFEGNPLTATSETMSL